MKPRMMPRIPHPITGVTILVAPIIASAVTRNADYFIFGYPLAIIASFIVPRAERWP